MKHVAASITGDEKIEKGEWTNGWGIGEGGRDGKL
jgi:hypothetical protein